MAEADKELIALEGMEQCPGCRVQLPEDERVCDCGLEFWPPDEDEITDRPEAEA